jgi:putative hydrolase of the HAD superfamily
VIFDLFGTLVPVFDREGYFAALYEAADALDLDPELFAHTFRDDATKRTTGVYSDLKANIADIARRLGAEPDDAALQRATDIRTNYTRRHITNPYPDAILTLRALIGAGIPVMVLSDCSPETPPLWGNCPLSEFVAEPVLSCSVGMRKPDPRIYQLACERLGRGPYEAVFVGDGDSHELPGAHEVGLFSVLIERGEHSAFRVEQAREAQAVVHDLQYVLDLLEIR